METPKFYVTLEKIPSRPDGTRASMENAQPRPAFDGMTKAEWGEICMRIRANIERVDALIALSGTVSKRVTTIDLTGKGKKISFERIPPTPPPIADVSDILRSAVVLLHALMEDGIRSCLSRCYPITEESFRNIPILGIGRPGNKVDFAELFPHRDKTVAEVFRESVREHVHRRSFSDYGQVRYALEECGVHSTHLKQLDEKVGAKISALIARRHKIVHNADFRGEPTEDTVAQITPIDPSDVISWRYAVEAVCGHLIASVPHEGYMARTDSKLWKGDKRAIPGL
jgi:hypothetical protein